MKGVVCNHCRYKHGLTSMVLVGLGICSLCGDEGCLVYRKGAQ